MVQIDIWPNKPFNPIAREDTRSGLTAAFGIMSEWPSHWISDPAQVSALLETWRGATAQAWAYSVSHSQLPIRVHWERKPVDVFGLFLYFKNCSRVSFNDAWPNFDAKVTRMAGSSGQRLKSRTPIVCSCVVVLGHSRMKRKRFFDCPASELPNKRLEATRGNPLAPQAKR